MHKKAPVTIIMITLNEEHNIDGVFENIVDWAEDIVIVDSFSEDKTVDKSIDYGAKVIQNEFKDFGSQWNFALNCIKIKTPWTMKLDPDERLSDELKISLTELMNSEEVNAISLDRRLWFMGKPLPILQNILRVWKTGECKFSNVPVNEYPIVKGNIVKSSGYLEHFDSPTLHHWYEKQNKYTTSEALSLFNNKELSYEPKLFGSSLQRRMWLKKNFYKTPFRYFLLFIYNWIICGAWKAGYVGYVWSKLRSDVMRMVEYKTKEMNIKQGRQ